MAIEIVGESIMAGLKAELEKHFPGINVYSEQIVARPPFPHFFIGQVTMSSRGERKGKWWLHYLLSVRYRIDPEPFLDMKLEAQLDEVCLGLLERLEYIHLGGIPVHLKSARAEKIDGIVQYFCEVDIQVAKTYPETAKQQKFNYEIKTR